MPDYKIRVKRKHQFDKVTITLEDGGQIKVLAHADNRLEIQENFLLEDGRRLHVTTNYHETD